MKDRGDHFEAYDMLLSHYAFSLEMAGRIREAIEKEGFTVKHTNKSGATNEVENPKIKIYRELTNMALGIARQFGFTPASRAKLKLGKKKRRHVLDGL